MEIATVSRIRLVEKNFSAATRSRFESWEGSAWRSTRKYNIRYNAAMTISGQRRNILSQDFSNVDSKIQISINLLARFSKFIFAPSLFIVSFEEFRVCFEWEKFVKIFSRRRVSTGRKRRRRRRGFVLAKLRWKKIRIKMVGQAVSFMELLFWRERLWKSTRRATVVWLIWLGLINLVARFRDYAR